VEAPFRANVVTCAQAALPVPVGAPGETLKDANRSWPWRVGRADVCDTGYQREARNWSYKGSENRVLGPAVWQALWGEEGRLKRGQWRAQRGSANVG
jgi:hypothetical protein